MTPTPEQLALARYVYWQYMERTAAEKGVAVGLGEKEKCLRGDFDHQHGVQIALAAIIETSERAAGLAENYKFPSGWVGNDGQAIIADALRSGEHLK